ncbi:sugar phosphate isomerase/epimerase family protein [Lederbergia panacisoli]|uniref:sugar phosphate isomerase/epimerase family protein n=1 Tax=Lederbergia panacisoli TaxID=1255251 RepID=UPI00214BB421|nr:sugar phosphate isomerase/epimerase family protein [Lederbergia panacisoli]MCR2822660.1 sugar phosphate isomerase/epimerase [Lederbergia panacisoli]
MKFGCCLGIDSAKIAYEAGFDFIECTVVSLIPEKTDREFAKVFKQFQDSPLPVEACNVFLPGDLKIVGETVDHDRIKRYIEIALQRVHQVGAKIIVFGSGRARSIPDGFSRERAEEQILQFLRLAADYADPPGITIVIEPLNKKESNIINSVLEAEEFAKKVNHKSIQVLADFYHMDEESEPLEDIVKAKEFVKHIHLADTGRFAPGTGHYPYDHFVDCLQRAHYSGRISIECQWKDLNKELANSREFLKETFEMKRV